MREVVIVGRPNSGKTMFALNFAAYMGAKMVDVTFRSYDDILTCRHYSIAEGKRELCSSVIHKTRLIQSMQLRMTIGKTPIEFILNDTCGISEQIHADLEVRRGMAQTLKYMRNADYIFHILDMVYWSNTPFSASGNIDHEIYQYGLARNAYTILANKIDIPIAREHMNTLYSVFPRAKIIPISALMGAGFKEVKACVARTV